MSKATDGKSIDWLTSLCNTTIDRKKTTKDWLIDVHVHVEKGIHWTVINTELSNCRIMAKILSSQNQNRGTA